MFLHSVLRFSTTTKQFEWEIDTNGVANVIKSYRKLKVLIFLNLSSKSILKKLNMWNQLPITVSQFEINKPSRTRVMRLTCMLYANLKNNPFLLFRESPLPYSFQWYLEWGWHSYYHKSIVMRYKRPKWTLENPKRPKWWYQCKWSL